MRIVYEDDQLHFQDPICLIDIDRFVIFVQWR